MTESTMATMQQPSDHDPQSAGEASVPSGGSVASEMPVDRLGRGLDDLRISVIDRCNFRCTFCMPAHKTYRFLPRAELLTFEEIERLARIFVGLGVRKLRLTGGEPLLRRDLPTLIEMLAAIPGVEDLALTTNGFLLPQMAQSLADAGLDRVTVSVESLDQETFGQINGLGHSIDTVLEGIDAAAAAGLGPIKINTVVMKGTNDHEVVPIARFFKERGHIVRFIEFMDVGTVNDWTLQDVLSAEEIMARVHEELPMEPLPRRRPNDVALRYRYLEDAASKERVEVGAIASITQPFCGDCTRARLTSKGELVTCLFAEGGTDLRAPLRSGADDAALEQVIRGVWADRTDRYSEERTVQLGSGLRPAEPKIEMFRVGG